MAYRQNCRSRSRGIHSHSARNNSESNHPTIQTTTIHPAGRGYQKGIQSLPHHPTTRTRKATNHAPASRNATIQNLTSAKVPPAIRTIPRSPLPHRRDARTPAQHRTHVKMGRISPSPSRAFTPHYSHSLNSIPSITPLTTRTFTLTFPRSLKNLKIRDLIA